MSYSSNKSADPSVMLSDGACWWRLHLELNAMKDLNLGQGPPADDPANDCIKYMI